MTMGGDAGGYSDLVLRDTAGRIGRERLTSVDSGGVDDIGDDDIGGANDGCLGSGCSVLPVIGVRRHALRAISAEGVPTLGPRLVVLSAEEFAS